MVRDIVIILIILIGGYFCIRRFYRFALVAIVFYLHYLGNHAEVIANCELSIGRRWGAKTGRRKNSLFKNSTDFGCIFCNIVNKKRKC